MEETKMSFFDALGKKGSFVFGIVGGFLVLCTIGFFILLGITLNGETSASDNPTLEGAVKGPKKFSECLDTGKYASAVNADTQLGSSLGVQGTPATFINGYLISGAYPIEAVKQVIDTLLADGTPDFDFLQDDEGNISKTEMPELPNVIWAGGKDAKVSLVTFSDFECPYCGRFAPTVDQVLADYGDQIRFTFRHYPLSFHANAQKAAEAFECAKEQGVNMEMHDKLFELSNAKTMSVDNYKKAATELGLK
ncbi:MAG: thioredoxin domain-containing protein [Candidatus Magasanikbacteria bacterium]